jgi:crotonobetainyl-CoA:carnitine CoA-transferase CaiB-like acyl-CoA transferase
MSTPRRTPGVRPPSTPLTRQAVHVSFALRVSATPAASRRPAPLLGEHTAEVLGELGLVRAEIDRLAAAGVVALA